MKWIKTEDALPKPHERVLVWHKQWKCELAELIDINNKSGHIEWVSNSGRVFLEPNRKFPENLSWRIGFSDEEFNSVTHWANLPTKP
jgi:hypothetical protein